MNLCYNNIKYIVIKCLSCFMTMEKFTNIKNVKDWQVATPTGWQDIKAICKTIPFKEYRIETTSFHLNCADNHILIDENDNEVFAQNLKIGDKIQTIDGVEEIVNIYPTGNELKMFDLDVPIGNLYYTNGIVSHNTTTSMGYLLHKLLFNDYYSIAVLGNKAATAAEILQRVEFAYENLPWFLQPGVTDWNKGSFRLANGSKIFSAATSSSSVRSKSLNCVYLDEFAHIDNDEEFYTSTYPVISSGKTTQVIITSTPKGMNLFYKLWNDAENGRNEYVPIAYDWRVVPGRDEKWKQETISNTSPVQFAQEYECSFLGSADTLISGKKLQALSFNDPIEVDERLTTYAKPTENHSYILVADCAEGTGNDYSVITVFDITQFPIRIAAIYRDNLIMPYAFAGKINEISMLYKAYILVESNSIGNLVLNTLWNDYESEYVLRSERDIVGFSGELGIRTTTKVKSQGCSILKELIENDRLIVDDFNTINELYTFTLKGKTYQAEQGKHDDIVMTLVLFAYLTVCGIYEQLTDISMTRSIKEEYESNFACYIDDGIEIQGTGNYGNIYE